MLYLNFFGFYEPVAFVIIDKANVMLICKQNGWLYNATEVFLTQWKRGLAHRPVVQTPSEAYLS